MESRSDEIILKSVCVEKKKIGGKSGMIIRRQIDLRSISKAKIICLLSSQHQTKNSFRRGF